MWVFTKYGFYSVVKDMENEGHVLVRAREASHLQNLINEFEDAKGDLRNAIVVSNPERDYLYRISISQVTWADILDRMAREIDYPNYKEEVSKSKIVDTEFYNALHYVWLVMNDYQYNHHHEGEEAEFESDDEEYPADASSYLDPEREK